MSDKNISDDNSSFQLIALGFISLPFLVTAWKFFAFDYKFYEVLYILIPALLLDLAIALLAILVLGLSKMKPKLLWIIGLICFWSFYFMNNDMENAFDWIMNMGLAILSFVFLFFVNFKAKLLSIITKVPYFFSELAEMHFTLKWLPILIYPCFILFGRVGNTMTDMDRINEQLNKKDATTSAKNLIHSAIVWEGKHYLGREVYRNYLHYDENFGDNLDKIEVLSDNVTEKLNQHGLIYADFTDLVACNWEDLYYGRVDPNAIKACGKVRAYRQEDDGHHYITYIHVTEFDIKTTMTEDSIFRVVSFPDDLDFTIGEKTDKRMF